MRKAAALSIALILALAGMALFAIRAGRQARHFHELREPIRPWMSVPFVAHVHHVPEQTLFAAIGVTPLGPRDRRSIRHIAHELHRPVPDVVAQLQRAVDQARRSSQGPPIPQ